MLKATKCSGLKTGKNAIMKKSQGVSLRITVNLIDDTGGVTSVTQMRLRDPGGRGFQIFKRGWSCQT